MSIFGIAKKGFGMLRKQNRISSPVFSKVKPSVHKTKKAQKTSEMKIQFNKQKSRTLSDRKMGKKEPTLTEYANRKLTTRERNEASKKMFDDANGKK